MKNFTSALLTPVADFCSSLLGRSPVLVTTGIESRPDNMNNLKDFFFVEINNSRSSPLVVRDVSLLYHGSAKAKSIHSMIVSDRREYPVLLGEFRAFRLHLLPSVIDLPRLAEVRVKLDQGKEIRRPFLLSSLNPTSASSARPTV